MSFPFVARISSITDVAERQLCAGCGACAAMAPKVIRMVDDLSTGRRPLVQEGQSSAAALAVCPGISLGHERSAWARGVHSDLADDWGPVLAVYEGHAADEELRLRGSSGGVASALALWCLDSGAVDAILHTRARPDAPVLNTATLSRTRADILEASGSRYAPSSPVEGLTWTSDRVALIGKPCDVAGASLLARARPEVDERLRLTVAIFCAGAPSTQATLDYIARHAPTPELALESVRYRGMGWPGDFVASLEGGSEVRASYAQSWGELQAGRPWRCRICPDHSGEFADISVGDPWHRPPTGDEPGRSLVIARTARGAAALQQAIAAGALCLEPVDPALIEASQEDLLRVRSEVFGRLLAMGLARIPRPSFLGMGLARAWWRHASLRRKLASVFGTLRRLGRYGLHRKRKVVPHAEEARRS